MNTRIQKLRDNLFENEPRICSERCVIFTDSMKKSEGEPIALRRSKAFYDVLDQMTVYVQPHELIVGNQAQWPKSAPIFPEYSVDWLISELNGDPYYLNERPGDRFNIDEKTKDDILECVEYWKGQSQYEMFREELPDYINAAWDANVIDDTWVSSQGLGNVIPDFEMVLQKGLIDVMNRVDERIEHFDETKEPIGHLHFLQGAKISNEAVCRFAERIAEECERQANEGIHSVERKKELLKLAEINRRVPKYPARTFHEALQAVYTILLAIHLETNGHANSLGRFDQYLYPFYEKDIKEGRLTRDDALELIEAFYIKCNEINKLRSWPDTCFFIGYQMFINLAIGGQTKDGKDATNEVSYLCIDACEDVRLFTPSVSLKYFEGTSDEIMMRALEAAIVHQGGQPAFYNDIAFMRTLENMGISKDDSYNWAPDGCIEASIPGKWDFAAKGPWLNVLKVLEITLNNGVDPKTGTKFKPTDIDVTKAENTDQIFEEYTKMLRHFIDLQVETEHKNDEILCKYDINPFRATLIDDCIGRGLDLVEGGSIYSVDGGPTAGSISAGDALAAIDTVVFRDNLLTLDQLLHAMQTDFSDMSTQPTGAQIQAILKNRAPKFGNDDDDADKWVVKVEEYIGSTYHHECRSSKFGKGPVPCCYSYSQSPVTGNISFGKSIGATPDGRNAGDPVNNGVSPANGSEKEGASAAINSVAKLPTIYIQKGGIFNMRLTKDAVATKEDRQKIIDAVKVFFKNYGQQIQFNVVDDETLKDAMEHPDDYKDLMVRVSGYSALFTSLSKEVQLDVMNRAELAL